MDESTWGGDAESSIGRPKLQLSKRSVALPAGGRADMVNDPFAGAQPQAGPSDYDKKIVFGDETAESKEFQDDVQAALAPGL